MEKTVNVRYIDGQTFTVKALKTVQYMGATLIVHRAVVNGIELKRRYACTEERTGLSVSTVKAPLARTYKDAINRAICRITAHCQSEAEMARYIERNLPTSGTLLKN